MLWTHLVEWYVVRCGPKNGQQINVCAKEIALHVIDSQHEGGVNVVTK